MPRRRIDTPKASRIEIESLEARILYSADLNPFAVDAADLSTSPSLVAEVRLIDTPIALALAQSQRELLVIDESVIEQQAGLIDSFLHEQPLDSAGRQRLFDVRVIDSAQDGLDQLSKIAAEGQKWSAVHLISHGSAGSVALGNGLITNDTLSTRASQVAGLESLFTGQRDFLLYGCNLASNSLGQLFLSRLGELTHSDIAANSAATGGSIVGDEADSSSSDDAEDADWSLDYNYGQVQTALALSVAIQNNWQGVLATFTVTNINDSGAGSFRQAIINANGGVGADTINFNIAGTGLHSISLLSALPLITGTVNIDGYSQAGSSANTSATGSNAVLNIELNGASAGINATGLSFVSTAGNSSVSGLVINRFSHQGIFVNNSDNNIIQGNFIGTDDTGTFDLSGSTGNSLQSGIYLTSGSSGNVIGGTTTAAGNVISGNNWFGVEMIGLGTDNNLVQGNYIGTSASGTVALGNTQGGVSFWNGAANNTVGGSVVGARNIISGNGKGILSGGSTITPTGNNIIGNYIGTDVTGTLALSNLGVGIDVSRGTGMTIGGTSPLGRNIISGNDSSGVYLSSVNSNNNSILGNYIGTDASGASKIANGGDGITIDTGASYNIVGGAAPGSGNVISGNISLGIYVSSATTIGNQILGNYVGLNAAGNAAISNGAFGIAVDYAAVNTRIGGSALGEGNVISGNTGTIGSNSRGGIYLYEDSSIVQGNIIGLSADKSSVIGNGGTPIVGSHSGGIVIPFTFGSTSIGGALPGQANTISGNIGSGIANLGSNVTILGNSIYGNTLLGIDLSANGVTPNDVLDIDTGPNNLQNYPLLYAASVSSGLLTITGEIRTEANKTYRLEFFRTPMGLEDPTGYGEGLDYLAYINYTTDGAGFAAINILTTNIWAVVATDRLSATATEVVAGNNQSTSEFSMNIVVSAPNFAPINTVPGAQTVNEDTSLSISGLAVNDSDGNLTTTQLSVNNGVLNINLSGGATLSAGANGSNSLTLTGTQSQINNALATLSYRGILNFNGSDSLSVLSTDSNGAGDSDLISITVTPVNDAPVLTISGSGSVTVGATYTLNLSATDVDGVTISSWTINWGDSAIQTIAGNPTTVTHVYAAATNGFVFNVTASVTDANGQWFQSKLLVPSWSGTDDIHIYAGSAGTFAGVMAPLSDGLNDHIEVIQGPNGHLFISGNASSNVLEYLPNGTLVGTFVSPGAGGLTGPAGMAFGADGKLYVADYVTGNILRYNGTTGAFLDVFVAAGTANLTSPLGLDFGPDGMLYVTSRGDNNILRFNPSTGARDITFNASLASAPESFAFGPDGNIYVPDPAFGRVLRLSGVTGAYMNDFVAAGSGGLAYPTSVAFGPDGNLYVGDQNIAAIRKYNGVTGTSMGDYVASGYGGLVNPGYFAFLADHQVAVSNVAPVNTVPGAQTASEDTLLAISGLSVSDANGNLVSTALSVSNGKLQVNLAGGATISAGANNTNTLSLTGTQAQINAALATLSFQGNLNFNGSDTLSMLSTDASGATDNDTVAINVNAINDAPVVSLTSIPVEFTEQSPVGIASALTLSDVDSTLLNSASISLSSNYLAGDELAFTNMLGISGAWNSGSGVLSLTGTASVADYQTALRSITFYIPSDNPSTPQRVVSIQVFDGLDTSLVANRAININPVNDEQVLVNNLGLTVAEGSTNTVIDLTRLLTTDVDNSDVVLQYTLTSTPANGVLKLGGVTLALTSTFTQADINAGLLTYSHNGSESTSDNFSFSVDDGSGTSSGGTFTIAIIGMNDAPVLNTSATLNPILEDQFSNAGTLVSSITDTEVSDADVGSIKGIAVYAVDNTNGTWQYSLDGSAWLSLTGVTTASARLLSSDATTSVRFVPSPNFNGNPGAFNYVAWDQTSGASGGLADVSIRGGTSPFSAALAGSNLNVVSVNDAPSGANGSQTIFENTAGSATQLVFGPSDFGFVDAFDTPANLFAGVYITSLPSVGSLTLSGLNVTTNQFISSADLLVGNLVFTPIVNGNGLNYDSFSFRVMDNGGTANGGMESDVSSRTLIIHVTPVNTAPQMLANSLAISEGGSVVLSNAEINTSDFDHPNSALTITVSGLSRGQFEFVASPGTAILSFTQADIDAGFVRFVHDGSQTPPAYSLAVSDGSLGFGPQAAVINYSAINSAPIITTSVSALSLDEDTSQSFSLAGGNAIVLGDADAGASQVELTLTAANSKLFLAKLSGLTFISGANGSAALVVRGNLTNLNAALDGMVLAPDANFNGSSNLDVSVNDLGNTGSGGAIIATLSIPVTVLAVNDAPVASGVASALAPVLEDALNPAGASVFSLFAGLFIDSADASNPAMNQFAGVAVRAYPQNPAEGAWQYTIDGGSTWLYFGSLSDSAALALAPTDLIRFVPAADYHGTPLGKLSLRLVDNSSPLMSGSLIDMSVFNSTSAFSSGVISLSTFVTSVNDAPNITSNGGGSRLGLGVADLSLTENSTAPIVTFTANDIDLPANILTYSISGGADAALFSIDASTGSLSLNLAALPAGLNFEAPLDSNGDGLYLVQISVSDGVGGFDTQLVRLTIINLPEAPTSIAGALLKIAENTDTSAGVTVFASLSSVAATGDLAANPLSVADQDSADLHSLSIIGGADAARFTIIGSPGNYQLVFHAGVLDFEAQGAYQVILRATDPNGQFVDRSFALAVLDVNEAPVLTPLTVTINENPLAMQLLGSMNFVDQDSGDTLTVRILPPTPGSTDAALLSALSIDATGQVFISDPVLFDYESRLAGLTSHRLNLLVEITDSRGLASTASLNISLRDINETPSDLQAALKLSVNQPGEPIAHLLTSDQDSSERFTYSLVDNPSQVFKLDVATGAISLSALGETLINSGRVETLTVLVTDKGGLQISRTFALKMPTFFAPQAPPFTASGDSSTPSVITSAEVVIVTGTSPTTSSPAPTSGPQGKPRSNPMAILTESDLGFTSSGNSADQVDMKAVGQHEKSRPHRFAETTAEKAYSQVFEIVFANTGVISQYGSLLGINPLFDSVADKRASSLLLPGGASYSKPAISGLLAAMPDRGDDAKSEGNNLSSLIGKEPIYIASALISAGAVWWAARGLALATAMMMGAPAWRQIDMLPVVLSPSKGFEEDTPDQNADLDTRLETIATTSFFNAEDGDLEEIAVGSLFEIQEAKPSR